MCVVLSPLVAALRTNAPRYYSVVLLLKYYLVFIIQRCGKNAFFTCGWTLNHWQWRADMSVWGSCLSCPEYLAPSSGQLEHSEVKQAPPWRCRKQSSDTLPWFTSFSKGVWNYMTKYCIWIALIQPKYHRVICILSTVYIVIIRCPHDVLIDMYNSTIFVHFEFCDMYIWVYDNVKIECIQLLLVAV